MGAHVLFPLVLTDQHFLIPFTSAVPCPSSLYVHKLYCAIIILCAVINFVVSLKFFYFYNFLSFILSTLPEGDVIYHFLSLLCVESLCEWEAFLSCDFTMDLKVTSCDFKAIFLGTIF